MTVYFGTDHAGFALKEVLRVFVADELGLEVVDCGAYRLDTDDDYPTFVHEASRHVSENPDTARAIVLGASGQGEGMVANKHPNVRAAVYYGTPDKNQTDAQGASLSMVASVRAHNNANVLSLGARFIDEEEAKRVVREWLSTPFTDEPRHVRRIKAIEI